MTAHEQLIAYLATLAAIVILVGIAAFCSASGRSMEAIGVGAAVTGLIGVIRMPSSRSVTVDNPPSDPVPTTPATAPE